MLKPKSIEVDIVHVVFFISLKIRIRTEGAWEGCPSQNKSLTNLNFQKKFGLNRLKKEY